MRPADAGLSWRWRRRALRRPPRSSGQPCWPRSRLTTRPLRWLPGRPGMQLKPFGGWKHGWEGWNPPGPRHLYRVACALQQPVLQSTLSWSLDLHTGEDHTGTYKRHCMQSTRQLGVLKLGHIA